MSGAQQPPTAGSLWVRGVCDSLLSKVLVWHKGWHGGKIIGTRPFMEVDGLLDIPTIREHTIAFHPRELEHAVRIMKKLKPTAPVTALIEKVLSGVSECQILPNGLRKVVIQTYFEDVDLLKKTLLMAKTGELSMEEAVEQAKQDGGSIWS